MRPNLILLAYLFSSGLFLGCSNKIDSSQQFGSNEYTLWHLTFWDTLTKNFPNKNLWKFEFDNTGLPKHFTRQNTEVNKYLFKKLTTEIKEYSNWKDHLRIFFYSLNEIDNSEVGIFFIQREFDGTSYSIDLLKVDDKGEIVKRKTLAEYWTAAECQGFTNSTVFLSDMTMHSLSVQDCFDAESEAEKKVDSVLTVNSIKNLDFRLIRVDSLN